MFYEINSVCKHQLISCAILIRHDWIRSFPHPGANACIRRNGSHSENVLKVWMALSEMSVLLSRDAPVLIGCKRVPAHVMWVSCKDQYSSSFSCDTFLCRLYSFLSLLHCDTSGIWMISYAVCEAWAEGRWNANMTSPLTLTTFFKDKVNNNKRLKWRSTRSSFYLLHADLHQTLCLECKPLHWL